MPVACRREMKPTCSSSMVRRRMAHRAAAAANHLPYDRRLREALRGSAVYGDSYRSPSRATRAAYGR